MRFQLLQRRTRAIIAGVTVICLDNYVTSWNESAIGLLDLHVAEEFREKGYGQTLLIETIRRLRGEMVTLAECHVPESNLGAAGAVRGAGFVPVDTGTVYQRTLSE